MRRPGQQSLVIVPCDLAEANAFVGEHHCHHGPVVGHKFSIAVADEEGVIRGVASIGRPVNRTIQDTWTLEVNRVATDGCPNACSALYAAAWRATQALGYKRLVTYTLNTEPGTSLKAAGWKYLGERGGGTWNRRARPRVDEHPTQPKLFWEAPNWKEKE